MCGKSTLILVFTMLSLSGLCQKFPSQYWHSGHAVLTTGDTLNGEVKYDLVNDIIRVNTGSKIHTLSARKIFFFEIFDVTVDTYRQFYVLPFNVTTDYKASLIFEVIFEGHMTLLARETIVNKTSQYNSYYWSGGTYTRQVLSYDFYFLDNKGNITFYTKKKRDLISILSNRRSEIDKYIRKNSLKVDKKRDLARIVSYYNAII